MKRAIAPSIAKAPGRRTSRAHLLPRLDFPLFPHATGRWAKKIAGRLYYFGPLADPAAAEAEYLRTRDYHAAGLQPPPAGAAGLTVADLANAYLTAKHAAMDEGELSRATLATMHRACALLVGTLGRGRQVSDLTPADFAKLRRKLAHLAPVGRAVEIQRLRGVFNWGWQSRLYAAPLVFGAEFRKPSRGTLRKARAAAPRRVFTRDECLAILAAAAQPIKAMVLLALNAGLGNADVSALPLAALDLERGIIDFPRPKTGIERRATLWPETVAALREAIAARPKPADPAHDGLVFLTRFGRPWTRFQAPGPRAKAARVGVPVDSLGLEFGKLLDRLSLRRPGVKFYALRHVFESIAGETRDQAAVDRIMGHTDPSIAGHYREWLRDAREDARLRAVAQHVRRWLFDAPTEASPAAGDPLTPTPSV